ncbi:hypothetical protein REPUB_Repub12eG0096200 [Reevesia pubescens]
MKIPPVYPRVKVRVQEEDDDHFPPPNDGDSSLFLRLIESISKQEKENQIESPPSNSITRITKAYVTSPATKTKSLSASKDNDGMIGSRNKLNIAISAASKKRPAEKIKPVGQTHKNVNLSPNITQSSPNIRKGKGLQTENVNLIPNITRSSPTFKGLKTENRGLSGRMRKDPFKPEVQRQNAHI